MILGLLATLTMRKALPRHWIDTAQLVLFTAHLCQGDQPFGHVGLEYQFRLSTNDSHCLTCMKPGQIAFTLIFCPAVSYAAV